MDSDHQNSNTERLINEEEERSFPQYQQHFEESSSGARQRSSASADDIPNSNSSGQSNPSGSTGTKPKQKISGSYKFAMIVQVLVHGMNLFGMFILLTRWHGLGFDRFDCMVTIFGLVQSSLAVYAAFEGSLEYIEKALLMMKIYVGLWIFSILTSIPYQPPLFKFIGLGLWIIFILRPTINARNRLRSAPKDNAEAFKDDSEEKHDPIQKLDSLGYVIYKYWLLIAFCGFIAGISMWENPPDAKITSDIALWVYIGVGCSGTLSFLAFLCLTFESIRRKKLKLILAAINLTKIFIAAFAIQSALESLFGEEGNDFSSSLKNDPNLIEAIGPIGSFLLEILILATIMYLLFIYGACKVRDILKDHEKYEKGKYKL